MPERPLPPPDECANCGAKIPRDARACRECGADEETGWREHSVYDDLDLPEEAFDDVPRRRAPARRSVSWYWLGTALVLLALCLLSMVFFR